MDIATYLKKIDTLAREHFKQLTELKREFAWDNNDVLLGDIISNGKISIIVEKFCADPVPPKLPRMLYYGTECNQNGTPKTPNKINNIPQDEIVKINKKPYNYPFKQ